MTLTCTLTPFHHVQPTRPAERFARGRLSLPSESQFLQLGLGAVLTSDILCQTPTSAALPRFQTRGVHRIPQLQFDAYYTKNGIPEFMSPEAFDFAWTQYQSILIEKLNLLTQGDSPDLGSWGKNRTPKLSSKSQILSTRMPSPENCWSSIRDVRRWPRCSIMPRWHTTTTFTSTVWLVASILFKWQLSDTFIHM